MDAVVCHAEVRFGCLVVVPDRRGHIVITGRKRLEEHDAVDVLTRIDGDGLCDSFAFQYNIALHNDVVGRWVFHSPCTGGTG